MTMPNRLIHGPGVATTPVVFRPWLGFDRENAEISAVCQLIEVVVGRHGE